jgi:hypothetical protein
MLDRIHKSRVYSNVGSCQLDQTEQPVGTTVQLFILTRIRHVILHASVKLMRQMSMIVLENAVRGEVVKLCKLIVHLTATTYKILLIVLNVSVREERATMLQT